MEKCTCNFKPWAFGLATGILWMALIVVMAIIADVVTGYGYGFIHAMQSVYIGYGTSFMGIVIGAVWSFLDGFIGGFAIAWLYNIFAGECKCCKPE